MVLGGQMVTVGLVLYLVVLTVVQVVLVMQARVVPAELKIAQEALEMNGTATIPGTARALTQVLCQTLDQVEVPVVATAGRPVLPVVPLAVAAAGAGVSRVAQAAME